MGLAKTPIKRRRTRRLFPAVALVLFASVLAAAWVRGPSGKWTSNGPTPSWTPGSLSVLAVDSVDPNLVFAGTQEGIYRSRDEGVSWEPINNGIPLRVASTPQIVVEALAIDPSRTGTLYVGLGQGSVNN